MGRSNVKTVAERRLPEIRQFLISLFNSADEIAHSDLVYTFFHPLLRDQQEADIHATKVKGNIFQTSSFQNFFWRFKSSFGRAGNRAIADEYQQLRGEIKFSLQYHRDALIVMIQHARSLPSTPNNPEPNTYVKVYLRPDQSKATKRKTKVVRKNCNPSFMETVSYFTISMSDDLNISFSLNSSSNTASRWSSSKRRRWRWRFGRMIRCRRMHS